MLKILYADCFGLSPMILVQFTVEMCLAASNSEKFTKNSHFWGSRSFSVIDVHTPGKHGSIACYDKQQICVYLKPFSR